ncbi:MAG TPA: S-methyl-5-thioribose-1-phosphate isomerase [Candidatus Hydrogenedentes bacterium]|nr:S-methyl-5-thioribose-1-phosphate isomerase [Candidatus Hydrogenedentota bacterium]HQE84021.1 S-methyl-5-thioribose-1-phosphate isomerase [Candidatus Hydrogenedentota bacterium]HQH52763.1 S-methyl-5-thioribose-1-phosphate isomerase [Candidatus Hydrogenedentota bacterium]HQM50039.1 S-methyl-5-thioribose-1-phosphate isomerase [Candidatus Hydrogenedentota bacterium]
MNLTPVIWRAGELSIIDQTLLPLEYREVRLDSLQAVWDAIRSLRVRGAPAIGVCAAFGVVVCLRENRPQDVSAALRTVDEAAGRLETARPTAVNLFWALRRMQHAAREHAGTVSVQGFMDALETEACAIRDEDTACCRRIGDFGAALIPEGGGVLTYCNAGALATSAYGTALAAMYRAHEQGRSFHVYASETRPLLQGARLTAWELMRAGIKVTLICDNMAAQVMREGRVQLVLTGADRIAANGDTANKIGTYGLAVLAAAHGVPFYVAAPLSTFDPAAANGDAIPIEHRPGGEITDGLGKRIAPEGVDAYNPAFDVTPARLIAGIVTERGILRPPFLNSISECF